MPMQTKKSNLAAGLKKHAEAPIDYGTDYTNLPGDINDGIAQLTSIKRGTYKSGPNKDKDFIRFEGQVKSPKTALDVKKVWEDGKVRVISAKDMVIEGLFTNIMIPLCDTNNKAGTSPVTQEEHEGQLANELKKLGDPADWKPGESSCLDSLEDDADLDALFETLCAPDNPIYFKFRTRLKEPNKDFPNSGTWDHNWDGKRGLEDYVPDADEGVNDGSSNGKAPPTKTPPKPAAKKPDPEPEPDATDDIDALVAQASDKKHKEYQASIDRLTAIAGELGITEDTVEKADSWADVAAMIAEAQSGEEKATEDEAAEPEAAAEDEDIHQVGKALIWRHPDPKNSKKSLKTDVEILTVNTKSNTATVKDLATGKPIMNKDKKPIAIPLAELAAD